MPALLPIKESSRELIAEVLGRLGHYFPDMLSRWRERLHAEFQFDGHLLAKLERLTPPVAASYFAHNDICGYFENLAYFGTRLARLNVDTRQVARALEIFADVAEPYLASLFGERHSEASAAMETLSSATFVAVAGAYYDAKTQESTSLLAVLDAELATDDLQALLCDVLKITCDTFEATFGVIMLRDPEGDLLRVRAAYGAGTEFNDETLPMGSGFAGSIAQRGELGFVLDASRDTLVSSPAMRRKAKSVWAAPLKSDGSVIGVLLLGFDKIYEWLPTERELMRAIADRSALAIARARMTEALREREGRIAELSAHLLRVQEEERKRISRELHDETGQGLMVIRLYLGMLESTLTTRVAKTKIRETLDVVDRTIEGIRRIIGRLSPLVLQELGLVAAIRKEAKDLAKNTGVKARVAISDEVGRLSSETEAAIYRVVQEALHNVAKHAQARSVNIQMGRENGNVRLLVEDDGVGMAPRASSRRQSFGLAGIRERVSMLHGNVTVSSTRGKGTRLEVVVPAEASDGEREPLPASQVVQFASQQARLAATPVEGDPHAKDQMPAGR